MRERKAVELGLMTDQPLTGLGIDDVIGDKRAAILKLAQQYGASNVRVFGSVARGDARPDSDVDFLVEFRDGASIFDAVGLWQDLTELLEREVDLVTEGGDEWFEQWIKRETVPL